MTVPKEWLKRRTTAQEYLVQRLAGVERPLPRDLVQKADAWVRKITEKMLPGDELWEYEYHRHQFAATGGLAIVRDGEIVESLIAWRS